MNPSLFSENIKIEIILTDIDKDNSIKYETTTKQLKEMYEKHNVRGLDIMFSQLYNELTNKNGE